MTGSHARLRHLWEHDAALIAPHAGAGLRSAEAYRLIQCWEEPQRAYHTLVHLAEMFDALDAMVSSGDLSRDLLPVARIACWYHDLAYDPRAAAGSNEHRSAAMARDHLHLLGADPAVVDVIEQLILMTADHQNAPDEPVRGEPARGVGDLGPDQIGRLTDAFHDADLWILAAPESRFDQYCAEVRVEYAHVPADQYAAGRRTILRQLVAPEQIYRTDTGQQWDQPARRNVDREIGRLAAAQR